MSLLPNSLDIGFDRVYILDCERTSQKKAQSHPLFKPDKPSDGSGEPGFVERFLRETLLLV